jgi:hypothetical protein
MCNLIKKSIDFPLLFQICLYAMDFLWPSRWKLGSGLISGDPSIQICRTVNSSVRILTVERLKCLLIVSCHGYVHNYVVREMFKGRTTNSAKPWHHFPFLHDDAQLTVDESFMYCWPHPEYTKPLKQRIQTFELRFHVEDVALFTDLHCRMISRTWTTLFHLNTVFLLNHISSSRTLRAMLSGSLVTTAWRILRLWMEETPSSFGGQLRIYWISSHGQPTRGGPGWSSSLRVGRGANNLP